MARHGLWIAGSLQHSESIRNICSPFDQSNVADVCYASPRQLEQTIQSAHLALPLFKKTSRYLRSELLKAIASGISRYRSEMVECIVLEAGKPRTLADIEVSRAIQTFTIASEEVKRFAGHLVPIDIEPGGVLFENAVTKYIPRGVVLAIAPFNFPLNLVAHKAAPALAVGAPVIIKPAPQAPGAATLLGKIFNEALTTLPVSSKSVPPSALQILHADVPLIEQAIIDPRISTISFTGSDRVGWMIQQKASRKKVALELGGNAALIIHSDADLDRAAARAAFGAFAYAGQICISVQRVFVEKKVFHIFSEKLISETKKLKIGNPSHLETTVGPLIDRSSLTRILDWISEAKTHGATALLDGVVNGNTLSPVILTNTKPTDKVNTEELFGPVITLESYDNLKEVVESVNQSRFGLQAGVFTSSMNTSRFLADHIDAGGILINEIPTFRSDVMPYGGVKDSGLGREGVRYTMEDYCEIKTILEWKGE